MNAPFRPETASERAERLAEQAWLDLREECEAEFIEWQRADYDRREDEDFGTWLVNKASWNGGGKYLEALDRVERQSMGRVGL